MTATSSHRSPQHRRSETKETSVLVVALDAPIPAASSKAEVLVLAPALNSLAPALGVGRRRRPQPSAGTSCRVARSSRTQPASTHRVASVMPIRYKRSRTPC